MCFRLPLPKLGLTNLEDHKGWLRRNPEIAGESFRIITTGGSNDLTSQAKGLTCLHTTSNKRASSLTKKEDQDVVLRIARSLVTRPSFSFCF